MANKLQIGDTVTRTVFKGDKKIVSTLKVIGFAGNYLQYETISIKVIDTIASTR